MVRPLIIVPRSHCSSTGCLPVPQTVRHYYLLWKFNNTHTVFTGLQEPLRRQRARVRGVFVWRRFRTWSQIFTSDVRNRTAIKDVSIKKKYKQEHQDWLMANLESIILTLGGKQWQTTPRTCPGCSVPEPHWSQDWALVPANPASKAEY